MGKGLIDRVLDSVFDEKWTGRRGEKLTVKELNLVKLFGRKGKTLVNIYIPKDKGETTEIDVVYITQKGIFVFESKNYSGWIFGNEKDTYWTVSLPNGQKNRFYNPVKQNRAHVKWLGKYIGETIPLFSVVVFSERCTLKKVTVESDDVKVIKRDRLYATVRSIWKEQDDVLSEEEIDSLCDLLKPLTDVDEAEKQAHVQRINEKINNNKTNKDEAIKSEDTLTLKICPRCGRQLVLRTAKKGSNKGQDFYGCSGYPACRYTETVKN